MLGHWITGFANGAAMIDKAVARANAYITLGHDVDKVGENMDTVMDTITQALEDGANELNIGSWNVVWTKEHLHIDGTPITLEPGAIIRVYSVISNN